MSRLAHDGSLQGTLTDSAGTLLVIPTTTVTTAKTLSGTFAPDGSKYLTLTIQTIGSSSYTPTYYILGF